MSRWTSKADRLAEHLRTLPMLDCIEICVHRENDLRAKVNQQLAKNKGTGVVVITWIGGRNPDRRSAKLRMGARYSITLWMARVMNDRTPADDIVEAIGEHIHGWVDPAPGSLVNRLEVTDIDLIPEEPAMLVYEILAEISRV
ncbi:MAG: hypothetical protein ACNA8L_10295 [Luteolibacter sp.]